MTETTIEIGINIFCIEQETTILRGGNCIMHIYGFAFKYML